MRRGAILALSLCAALLGGVQDARAEPGDRDAAPQRVVSMNLCTDQLALMVAAPGQLISVTGMSHDPRASVMAGAAQALPANRGLAEEIFLLQPDLVITGSFSSRATADMLRRLGIPVLELEPAYALADVSARLRDVGRALHREAAAKSIAAAFEADLARLRGQGPGPRAALYHANGYTSGERSLAGEILRAAGLSNVATELGLSLGGRLALESLVLAQPEIVITGRRPGVVGRADEVTLHPVLDVWRGRGGVEAVTDRDWICGTPHVLRAIRKMAAAREALTRRARADN